MGELIAVTRSRAGMFDSTKNERMLSIVAVELIRSALHLH